MGIPTLVEGPCVICKNHQWTRKRLPCPYLLCPNGARGLWVSVGKQKMVVYVRRRIKDELGLRYDWEKTSLNPAELLAPEEDDLVF